MQDHGSRKLRVVMLAVSAFLVFLTMLPFAARADQSNGDATAWRLTSINWQDNDKRGVNGGVVNIDEVTANAQGGVIRLTMNGKGPCAGKVQRFRFTWRFDRDITNIAGKTGDLAFAATATLEGESSTCLDGNPSWNIGEYGDLLGSTRGGWGIHYFKDPPNTLPGRMTFSVRLTNRTKEGIQVSLMSNWAGDYSFAGLNLQVKYLYEPVLNGSSGSSSISGNTTDASGGRAKIAFCSNYATRAVQQNQDNTSKRCGYYGDRWQSNYNNHYAWCLNVDNSAADASNRARDADLARCAQGSGGSFGSGSVSGSTGGASLGGGGPKAFARLTIPNNQPVKIATPFATRRGAVYVITASGVVSDWGGKSDGVDPVWCYAEWRCGSQGQMWQQLRIDDKGMSELIGTPIPYNPGHAYQIEIQGTGNPFVFYLIDAQASPGDNTGSIAVSVTEK